MDQAIDISGRKVLFAIPTIDGRVHASLMGAIISAGAMLRDHGVDWGVLFQDGCSIVSQARNALVKQFIDLDGTDLIFVDSDVHMEPISLLRLVALSTDLDVLCAAVPQRQEPIRFKVKPVRDEAGRMVMDDATGQLVEVERIGAALMNIRRHVVDTLAKKNGSYESYDETQHPLLFHFEVNEDRQYVGEDYYFCDLARAHGFRIYIDPLIKTWHCGEKEFEGDFLHQIVLPEMQEKKLVVNS